MYVTNLDNRNNKHQLISKDTGISVLWCFQKFEMSKKGIVYVR